MKLDNQFFTTELLKLLATLPSDWTKISIEMTNEGFTLNSTIPTKPKIQYKIENSNGYVDSKLVFYEGGSNSE